MRNGGYFRRPTIAGDTICFVTEDDLWSVPADGGVARRLTANLSEVSLPALSRDGTQVAFTSREEHHNEVWVMDADGGPARRLTWLGANTAVKGWTPDGRILAVSDWRQPFMRQLIPLAVDATTGEVEQLAFGPCRNISWAPDGKGVVLGRNTDDPARWKRYRGGTAGEIWIDGRGTGRFKKLLELESNLAAPMWIGSRIWFLSDHEGVGNLYSCRPTGADLRRHTDHHEYYARHAMTDGRRVVYQHAAELWIVDPDHDEARVVDVDFRSPRVQRNRRFVPADKFLSGYSVHPDGHAVTLESRGKLFALSLWEQAVHQLGAESGVRYGPSRWSADGSRVITISDDTGEDTIEVHDPADPTATKRLERLDIGVVWDMAVSPTASAVVLVNQRHELLLVDLDKGTVRELDRSLHGGLDGVTWSPDGQWIAYSFATSAKTRGIKVCLASTGETMLVTSGQFSDVSPSWDPDGDFLYFLSARTFDPVVDTYFYDLGFPRAVKAYLITLRRDLVSPLLPQPKGFGDPPAPEAPAPAKKPAAATGPKPTVIEFEGIGRRAIELPVPLGKYQKVVGLPGRRLLLLNEPIMGILGWSPLGGSAHLSLESFGLADQNHEVLVPEVSSFEVSADGATMLYRTGDRLRAVKAGEKPPEGPLAEGPPSRTNGWIDLDRVRVSVDPAAEWRQMYGEAWRLQRDHFWVADMSGVDWRTVHDRYLPLLDKVASRLEFSDLMWEMQGELGTSHAYEMGGDYRPAPGYAMGFLGADLELDRSGRWVVRHVVRGDGWSPEGDSPLDDPGVNVTEGETILAVNGRAVGRDVSPAQLLVHQAGLPVDLTIGDGRGRKPRTVTVTTMRDERPARYREWVEGNRAAVHEASDGRVGYLHIPDMGGEGFSEFHRAYLSEVVRDALVVDVRNNGGGWVSQVILDKLARTRIGYNVSRWGPVQAYPDDSPAGPLVCITDENAGSDGDIFTHCFKLLGLGQVVGKRTWGGVVGISPRHELVDRSLTTQPEAAFWFMDVGWGVENYGTDPDVDVDIAPHDWVAGRDPQLDTAVRIVVRELKRHKPVLPNLLSRPSRALPKLPPRAG